MGGVKNKGNVKRERGQKAKQVVRAPGLSHKRKYKSGLMLLEPLFSQHFQK